MSKFKATITKLNGYSNLGGNYVGEGSTAEIAIRRARQKAIDDGEALISGEIVVERKSTSLFDYYNDIDYRYYNTVGL